jgi:3'-phosphoadenosine 5'-phosphosulfate sulfotransferase (PAPS reductase)/FAD synthetase
MAISFLPLSDLSSGGQLVLPFHAEPVTSSVAITPEVAAMLQTGCTVAIGVSGGKDSMACALGTTAYLDDIRHQGPRVLVHADLGVIEWADSLPACQRLAEHLGLELIVVRRTAGDMLTRWQQRWKANVLRYRELLCVRLILPWSTPAMRFCTSELKLAPIASALRKRFPHHAILNVSGIRREESSKRSRMPVSETDRRLSRAEHPGLTWNPIIDWSLQQVLTEIHQSRIRIHDAYTVYGSSRVSCAFCIMSSAHDLAAAAGCEDNHAVFRSLVELEAESTFAFQGSRWLADTAPHLLAPELKHGIANAKRLAAERSEVESRIPAHLLYTKGWPTVLPTLIEAGFIADVRAHVSDLLSLHANYLTADSVRERYSALLEAKRMKEDNAALRRKQR